MTTKEVENLTDQVKLAYIARHDTDFEIRKEAVRRLTDQMVLSEVVICDDSWFVKNEAFKKINDQAALANIAKIIDCNNSFIVESVNKLVDKPILVQIAKSDCLADIRCQAIVRLDKLNKIMESELDALLTDFFKYMSSMELSWSPSVCNIVNTLKSFDCAKFGVKIEQGYADGYSCYSIHYKGKQIWRG